MTRSIWKGPFIEANLFKKLNKIKNKNVPITTWSRRSTILPEFIGYKFQIYNGNRFINVLISEEMVGHKLGEFAKTRKQVKHKGDKLKVLKKRK